MIIMIFGSAFDGVYIWDISNIHVDRVDSRVCANIVIPSMNISVVSGSIKYGDMNRVYVGLPWI